MVRRAVVVGGGVVGLCSAYRLASLGVDVTLLEARTLGSGASGGNTGWVTPTLSTPLAAPGMLGTGLASALDPAGALVFRPSLDLSWLRWLWQFRRSCSPARYREGVRALLALNAQTLEDFDAYRSDGIEFEMHSTGILVVARSDGGLSWFRSLFRELAELGYQGALEPLSGEEARAIEPALSDAVRVGMRAVVDRYVRPESLVQGLAARLRQLGVRLVEGAPATTLVRSAGGWVVHARDPVHADAVVIASGASVNDLLEPLGVKLPIVAAKGYSLTLQGVGTQPLVPLYLSEPKIGLSAYEAGLRVAGIFELPARAKGVSERRLRQLVRDAQPYLRDWRPLNGGHRLGGWAGMRPATPDSLPFIGPVPGAEGMYVAAGHGMLGVTLAPATARLVAALVTAGAVPAEAEPFRLDRRI